MVKTQITLIFLLIVLLSKTCFSQSTCDFYANATGTMMQNYTNNVYNPLRAKDIYGSIRVLSSGYVVTTYRCCFNKIILDPTSIYPQDISQCMSRLYDTSLLAAIYNNYPAKVKAELDSIAKVVFSAETNCKPVMYYTRSNNISDDCNDYIKSLDDVFGKYEDDMVLGGNGFKYINDMILAIQKTRKSCGFDILIKPKAWSRDTCTAANNNWLYPLVDYLDNVYRKKDYKSFLEGFYNLYQSVYRVKNVCNIKQEKTILSQE